MAESDAIQDQTADHWQKPTEEWTRPESLEVPERTYWPAVAALSVVMLLFGVLTSWVISLAGFVLFVVSIKTWMEELTRDAG